MRRLVCAGFAVLLVACEGPPGPAGPPGGFADGAVLLDASQDGGPPDSASVGDDAGGEAHSGRVVAPSGVPVVRGRVVLVPSERVARLADIPIDLTGDGAQAARRGDDEPLEDLVAREPDLLTAQVTSDGSYRFAQVPDGQFFVLYVPDPSDDAHLPGGQLARAPLGAASLRGVQTVLRVSGAPSPRAQYVGSSSCITCHARHGSLQSAHALTLRVPGRNAPLQDSAAAPHIDAALSAFARGQTLYFHACDAARSPACQVATRAPNDAASVAFRVSLGLDTSLPGDAVGHYFVELERGAARLRLPVALTLGGARTAQQFVVRSPLVGGGFSHFVLPFTFQQAGRDEWPDDRDKPWVAYRPTDWLADGALRVPEHAQAFERQCAGCHATGFRASGNASDGYRGSAVAERDGVYDLDGDGRKELLAVGCEACHGPGSEHLEQTPRGQRIVSPRLLTPERESLVCGRCHARHRGVHDELAPLDERLEMPRAGIARSSFLSRHVSRFEAPEETRFASGDPRLGFQQYGDFLRSDKYRSATLLVTCADCHDAHRSAGFAYDLRDEGGDAACSGCHAAAQDVVQHAATKVGYAHDRGVAPDALTCIACHMVRTGSSGARLAGLTDHSDPSRPVTIMHGDRATHRFVFEGRTRSSEQPTAATAACAGCHGSLFITP